MGRKREKEGKEISLWIILKRFPNVPLIGKKGGKLRGTGTGLWNPKGPTDSSSSLCAARTYAAGRGRGKGRGAFPTMGRIST